MKSCFIYSTEERVIYNFLTTDGQTNLCGGLDIWSVILPCRIRNMNAQACSYHLLMGGPGNRLVDHEMCDFIKTFYFLF